MNFQETAMPGLLKVHSAVRRDERGVLSKFFERESFLARGLTGDFVEDLYTTSRCQVLRGMHLQAPPHLQSKLVCCIAGDVLDVLLDLRKGSPTFTKCLAIDLSGGDGMALFVPSGIAHGFYVRSQDAVMLYKLSSAYVPQSDCGVLWNSIDFDWPDKDPIVSPRDRALPSLAELDSAFEYRGPASQPL
jgi:dTDP-4-dehydrorhamnose 3,5-epimerase